MQREFKKTSDVLRSLFLCIFSVLLLCYSAILLLLISLLLHVIAVAPKRLIPYFNSGDLCLRYSYFGNQRRFVRHISSKWQRFYVGRLRIVGISPVDCIWRVCVEVVFETMSFNALLSMYDSYSYPLHIQSIRCDGNIQVHAEPRPIHYKIKRIHNAYVHILILQVRL